MYENPLGVSKKIYAGIAIIAGAIYYSLIIWLELNALVCTLLTLFIGVFARLLAIKYQWSLPIFSYNEEK